MADHSNDIQNSMRELHDLLNNALSQGQQGQQLIVCSQAFDRLCLGYRNGTYSEDEVQSGLDEIRRELVSTESAASPLMPGTMVSARDSVLARNYRHVAQRLLDQELGSWDARHVDIVQGAISQLGQLDGKSSLEIASALQKRMSENVWMGNLELAENIQDFEREAKSVQQSLVSLLQDKSDGLNPEVLEIPESDRTLALNNEVEKTVLQASRRAQNAVQPEKNVRQLQYSESETRVQNNREAEILAYGSQRLKDAAKELVSAEYTRLAELYKSILVMSKDVMRAEMIESLNEGLRHAFVSQHEDNPTELRNHILFLSGSLKEVSDKSPDIQRVLGNLARMQRRAAILSEIMASSDDAERKSAQYLDARMLYEQKRMQFERRVQDSSISDMAPVLGNDKDAPVFSASTHVDRLQENLRRIRQIAQSDGDISVYAPNAGGEHASNAYKAIQTADQLTPIATPIPTLQSSLAHRSNRLLRDYRQLAYHPSVRNDMGFAGNRYEMTNQEQPLFKRVQFRRDNAEANQMLPALYRVSGIKVKENVRETPLRKSFDGINLSAENFELVKMLENQFNPKKQARMSDSVTGVAAGKVKEDAADPYQHAAEAVSEMYESTIAESQYGTDTSELVKNGHKAADLESSIRTEGRQLPASVQRKLAPFFNFDLSDIRIFAGPIAATAADAMGAHAFTLGKNIFIGSNKLDYQTPEGLGLLAHEIQHTSHFDSFASVDAKEQEAEAIESMVNNKYQLALEKGEMKSATPVMEDPSVLNNTQENLEEKGPAFDIDDVYDTICDRVLDMMTESMAIERIRRGD